MAPVSKRMAVVVGINYFNTEHKLHGCINDARAIQTLLISRFGFDSSYVQVLTDESESSVKPTAANIKAALNKMIDQAEAGDIIRSAGVDFRQLVNRVPTGASFTILSDSCHSGGLIDEEKEQIGPDTTPERPSDPHSLLQPRARFIPYDSLLQYLTSVTNIEASDVGTLLVTYFGEDASAMFRLPAGELHQLGRVNPDAGILLSGCQADETSKETSGRGVFSKAVETVFKEHQAPLTNRQ
ncbi:hypothetical protein Ancab_017237, partial [Ancistrocladus abbreviatus]